MLSRKTVKTKLAPKLLYAALGMCIALGLLLYINELRGCTQGYNFDTKIQYGSKTLSAVVANTVELRTRGLSGTDCLSKDSVMLFVFDSSATHGIWMKDMNYPIDIVWLDDNKRVVSIRSSVRPETYPEVFYPQYPARYVIELPAGTAESLGIREGADLYWTL